MKILGAFILCFAMIGISFTADKCNSACNCKSTGVCKCGEKDKKCTCNGCNCKVKNPPCAGEPKHPCVNGCKCGKCGKDCKCNSEKSCGSKDCKCGKPAAKPKCKCCKDCKCGNNCKCDSKHPCVKGCKCEGNVPKPDPNPKKDCCDGCCNDKKVSDAEKEVDDALAKERTSQPHQRKPWLDNPYGK